MDRCTFLCLSLLTVGCSGGDEWTIEVEGTLAIDGGGSGGFEGKDSEGEDVRYVNVYNEASDIGGESLSLTFFDDPQQRMPEFQSGVALFASASGLTRIEGFNEMYAVSDLVSGTFTPSSVSKDKVEGQISAVFGRISGKSYLAELVFVDATFEGKATFTNFGAGDLPEDLNQSEGCWSSGGAALGITQFYGDDDLDFSCYQAWRDSACGDGEVSHEDACAAVADGESSWDGPGYCPYC